MMCLFIQNYGTSVGGYKFFPCTVKMSPFWMQGATNHHQNIIIIITFITIIIIIIIVIVIIGNIAIIMRLITFCCSSWALWLSCVSALSHHLRHTSHNQGVLSVRRGRAASPQLISPTPSLEWLR